MPPRRLVRKRPLWERITAQINVMDTLLWLSEELETREYDPQSLGLKIGLAGHFLFVLARANATARESDDIFGDGGSSYTVSWLARLVVWSLTAMSLLNAFHAFTRVRLYRLFNADIDTELSTTSARRVPVTSAPVMSSPLNAIKNALSGESAEDRSHPDPQRDVWELSVWDPLPLSLRILGIFSPAHVIVYVMSLPISRDDPQPSVTVFNCLVLQAVFSGMLLAMQAQYTQQAKDTGIVNKEVMNEYNTKFVHPRLHPTVRDAATQADIEETENQTLRIQMSSAVGVPTTLLRRGFQVHPNTNYSKAFDPEGTGYASSVSKGTAPAVRTSVERPSTPVGRIASGGSIRKSMPVMASSGTITDSPGSLKARASMGTLNGERPNSFGAHMTSPLEKSVSVEAFSNSPGKPNPFADRKEYVKTEQVPVRDREVPTPFRRPAPKKWEQERYPERWSREGRGA